MSNPFMGRAPAVERSAAPELDLDPVLGSALAARGPQVPPLSLPAGAPGLGSETVDATTQPWLWVLSVHGGSGASTLAELVACSGQVGERSTWPVPDVPGHRSTVVLVARTHAHGLDRLDQAAAQWAGGTFPHVDLVGTVLVADGPRPTRDQRERLRRSTALTPSTWHLGWQEAWRDLTATDERPCPPRLRLTLAAIARKADGFPKKHTREEKAGRGRQTATPGVSESSYEAG